MRPTSRLGGGAPTLAPYVFCSATRCGVNGAGRRSPSPTGPLPTLSPFGGLSRPRSSRDVAAREVRATVEGCPGPRPLPGATARRSRSSEVQHQRNVAYSIFQQPSPLYPALIWCVMGYVLGPRVLFSGRRPAGELVGRSCDRQKGDGRWMPARSGRKIGWIGEGEARTSRLQWMVGLRAMPWRLPT